MKKTALWKNAWREIRNSWARFLALFGIILLGTGFFVGIRAAAPNMLNTSNQYYDDYYLEDLSLQSTWGIRKEDLEALGKVDGIDSLPYKTVDRQSENSELLYRIFPNFNALDSQVNHFKVKEGRLPENDQEIALDHMLIAENQVDIGIGDTITFNQVGKTDDDKAPHLKQDSFKVVGFVDSPMYIDKLIRGQTSIGDGALDAFAVVSPEALEGEYDSAISIRIPKARQYNGYSDDYDQVVADKKAEVEAAVEDRPASLLEEAKKDGQSAVDEGRQKLNQAQDDLNNKSSQLDQAQSTLDQAQAQLDQEVQGLKSQLPEGTSLEAAGLGQVAGQFQATQDRLNQEKDQLSKGREQMESAKKEIDQKTKDLDDQAKQLEELKAPTYLINDRSALSGISEYGDNAERISAIAQVFPWIFFLVAALVSYTSMSRMVDEQRSQVGTMKAIGYGSGDIAMQFLLYASLASLLGTVIGVGIGNFLFPNIIYNAYRMMYTLPDIQYGFYLKDILLALCIALLTTVGPAIFTTSHLLQENAAQLMRPKPPKQGEHILLEKWRWLWNHLNFSMKITLRNLFRYKGRNLMTVIGVAGSTALVLTGFGISDSISGLADRQYTVIESYDLVAQYANDLNAEDSQAVREAVEATQGVDQVLHSYTTNLETTDPSVNTQTVRLRVFNPNSPYHDFYAFNAVDGQAETYDLKDNEALISQKLARLLGLSEGDSIELANESGQKISLPVGGIVESYIFHDCFITENTYKNLISKDLPAPNMGQIQLSQSASEGQVLEDLQNTDHVLAAYASQSLRDAFNDTIESLNVVTLILIIAAALLAFIVLYSLTNINVSERIRELSTIKVLGAYPNEVTMYIFRETLLLTTAGILIGLLMGYGLTGYILKTVEVDNLIFPHTIHWTSYLYSVALTYLFTLIVMGIMHVKLKRVDMVEALKGVE
ncbi:MULTISPECIES: FtsX-like permease family protein [Aerococcus]|uniref:FtsX-like permease family protein n=1 Tax=Aerococcus urinae (strain CCUG 59500 / ACS-120-V-Col10a) TaxID=2976812 RepID=UPI0005A14767|nr:FtsX-like permease family protein [Aerococcus sp. Group 1]MCY3054985.1 FtsX-like permease family protein [Aerococcus sp. Group 1]MCY3056715.1 FtsX-like permease family protein [Aerococcus sp. Group 1]MCY3061486.1 FtsX-like permease family protein [Aerococcus sp. Group 1]